MSRLVLAVVVHPDGTVVAERVPDELGVWQRLVGGWIESVPVRAWVHAVVNETGLLDGAPINELATRVLWHLRPEFPHGLCGPVVSLGYNGDGDSVDCPEDVAALIGRMAAERAAGAPR